MGEIGARAFGGLYVGDQIPLIVNAQGQSCWLLVIASHGSGRYTVRYPDGETATLIDEHEAEEHETRESEAAGDQRALADALGIDCQDLRIIVRRRTGQARGD